MEGEGRGGEGRGGEGRGEKARGRGGEGRGEGEGEGEGEGWRIIPYPSVHTLSEPTCVLQLERQIDPSPPSSNIPSFPSLL